MGLVVDRLVVDVDDAGLEPVGQGQAPVGVAGEHPGGQPVGGVVGPGHGLLGAVDDLDGGHRAEGLQPGQLLSAGTSATRVARKQRPTRSPPASTSAPPATASATRPSTVSRARWLISGPITTPGSAGSPTLRPAVLAASRSR